MGNGSNEKIEFTRGDAERLKEIENKVKTTNRAVGFLRTELKEHGALHTQLNEDVSANNRFRRIVVRICIWLVTSAVGSGILASIAKAAGWLN
jgi:hypothetical protein